MSLTNYGIITGAGKSIGREVVMTFAENGVKGVILAGRTESDLTDVAEESKKYATYAEYRAVPMKIDVIDEQQVESMFQRAVQEFGRVDFVINSAGVPGLSGKIQDLGAEQFDQVMEINSKGCFLVTREALKVMEKQDELFTTGRNGQRSVGRGSIINISSLAGVQAIANGIGYVASKFATVGITVATACDNARQGIRANVVCPGWTESRMMDRICDGKPGWSEKVNALSPAGRMAKPEEVAGVCHFLCTDAASFVNGVAIRVDAGFSQTRGYY